MNFTKTTSYALSVLSFMAVNKSERMSANYLHEKLNIPYSYLRQVLGELSRSGFIHSTVGRSGGFVLSRDKGTIYLSEIVDATEGMRSLSRCIMGFSECPFNNLCVMHNLWEKIRSEILHVLKNTSLADLIYKEQI